MTDNESTPPVRGVSAKNPADAVAHFNTELAPRARYSFTVHPVAEAMPRSLAAGVAYPVIAITDHDDWLSVTNDAENVLANLARGGLDLERHRVICRDAMGVWDELLVGQDGTHAGFAPLGATELSDALQKLDARYLEENKDFADLHAEVLAGKWDDPERAKADVIPLRAEPKQ